MATGRPLGNMVINLSLNSTSFTNTLDEIKREIRQAQTAMKANLAVVSQSGDEYETLSAKVNGLNQVMSANQRQIEALQKKYKEAVSVYGEASKEARNYAIQINNAVARQAAWERQLQQTKERLAELNKSSRPFADVLNEIKSKFSGLKDQAESFAKEATVKIGAVTAGISTMSATMAPAIIGVGGLGAAFTSAGVGVIGFGKVATSALKDVFDASDQLTQAQEKLNQATNPEERKKALEEINAVYAGLDSNQQKALKSLQSFKSFWGDFTKSFEKPVFNVFIQGLNLAKNVLNMLKPTIQGSAKAIEGLMNGLNNALQSSQAKQFFNWLAQTAPQAITTFGRIFGNVFGGVMNLFMAFTPLASNVQTGLVNLTQKFQNWTASVAKSAGFKQFIEYAKANAPILFNILKNVGIIVVNVIKILTPVFAQIGHYVLVAVNSVTGFVASLVSSKEKMNSFKQKAVEVFQSVKNFVQPVISAVANFVGSKIKQIKKFWDTDGEQFKHALVNAFNMIRSVIAFVMPFILIIVKSVWGNIKGVINGSLNVIMGAVRIFTGLFTGNWHKMWEGIKQLFKGAFQVIWNWMQLMWIGRMLKGALSFIGLFKNAFKGLWNALKSIFSAPIKWIVNLVKNSFSGMHKTSISIFNALKNSVKVIWNAIKDHTVDPIKSAFKTITSTLSNLRTKALDIFNNLKDGAGNIWNKMIETFKSLPSKMADALKKGAKSIGNAMKSVSKVMLEGIAKGVNGVIDGIDWILDKVHAPKKVRIPEWHIPQYAKGTDNHPGGLAVVSDGKGKNKQELIVLPNGQAFLSPKEETIMNLPKGTSVLNGDATAELLSVLPKYASGTGWLQSAWDTVKDVASDVGSKVKDLAINIYDYITDPQKLLEKVISKTANLDGVLEPTLSLTKSAIKIMIKGAKDWIEDKIIGDIQPSGNATEDVKRWVAAGMKIAGISGSNWFNGLVTIAMHESGGNPKAINLWDINAKLGHPSAGLMQMIEPTFRRYAKKGYTDWMNPIHQVVADIFYIKDRYGSIENVPGIRALRSGGRYVGYANGGFVTNEQIARIAEGNKPEVIIPLTKRTRALQLLAKTQQVLGIPNGSTVQINNDNSDLIARQDQLIELLQQQNAILLKLLAKDQGIQQLQLDIPFNIDGRQIARATAKYNKEELDRLNRLDARYGGVITT